MNYYYKYNKYKIKYNKLIDSNLKHCLKLYYGLYDIQYKINKLNDIDKNIKIESIINYLNDTHLADKCFNNCDEITKQEKQYCRRITINKCVPNCVTSDDICSKTKLSFNSQNTNKYSDKKINSRFDGKTNFIKKLIYLKLEQFIVIIENKNYIIILFPSGYSMGSTVDYQLPVA